MRETLKHLRGDFLVLDLGSEHSNSFFGDRADIAQAATLIEIDAQSNRGGSKLGYYRHILLRQAVAGKPGPRAFTERSFADCSSFCEPDSRLLEEFEMQRYFQPVATRIVECQTLEVLLNEQRVSRVDFLKTDLEGMDFEILASAPRLVRLALCVQVEVRFQPLYSGEPPFHEVAAYLSGLGFELIALRPEIWKYATPNRHLARDGRLAWADAVFFLSPGAVRQEWKDAAWLAFAKQAIVAKLLRLGNFSEHIVEANAGFFPEAVRLELRQFARPSFGVARWMTARANDLPYGWMLVAALRRASKYVYHTCCAYREKMVATQ